jgi:hypothetical protein
VPKIEQYRPGVVAFTGKQAAGAFAGASNPPRPRDFGPAAWTVAGRPGFVPPGPSGSNNAVSIPLRRTCGATSRAAST